MNTTDMAILYVDLPTALARSAQMANNLSCDGVLTKYWYACIQLTNGQGALIVESSIPGPTARPKFSVWPGPTALSRLTPAEIAARVTYASIQSLLPVSTTLVST